MKYNALSKVDRIIDHLWERERERDLKRQIGVKGKYILKSISSMREREKEISKKTF